jgi:hypothetical protein
MRERFCEEAPDRLLAVLGEPVVLDTDSEGEARTSFCWRGLLGEVLVLRANAVDMGVVWFVLPQADIEIGFHEYGGRGVVVVSRMCS